MKWEYAPKLTEFESSIKIGDEVLVKGGHPSAGKRYRVTRIDGHAYPICAGYQRFKGVQLHLVKGM